MPNTGQTAPPPHVRTPQSPLKISSIHWRPIGGGLHRAPYRAPEMFQQSDRGGVPSVFQQELQVEMKQLGSHFTSPHGWLQSVSLFMIRWLEVRSWREGQRFGSHHPIICQRKFVCSSRKGHRVSVWGIGQWASWPRNEQWLTGSFHQSLLNYGCLSVKAWWLGIVYHPSSFLSPFDEPVAL